MFTSRGYGDVWHPTDAENEQRSYFINANASWTDQVIAEALDISGSRRRYCAQVDIYDIENSKKVLYVIKESSVVVDKKY